MLWYMIAVQYSYKMCCYHKSHNFVTEAKIRTNYETAHAYEYQLRRVV